MSYVFRSRINLKIAQTGTQFLPCMHKLERAPEKRVTCYTAPTVGCDQENVGQAEALHRHPGGGVPGREPRHGAPQPGRRASAQAAAGRDQGACGRKNAVQARSFAEMLESTLRRYQNRAITAAQVIEEMIQVGRDLRAAGDRGAALGLTEDEVAFYDALETNDSAVKVLGDDKLRLIAIELVEAVRKNVTIDWTLRESVRAQIRVMVRRILRKHGYPPDLQAKATKTVLEQAELLSAGWAAAA